MVYITVEEILKLSNNIDSNIHTCYYANSC